MLGVVTVTGEAVQWLRQTENGFRIDGKKYHLPHWYVPRSVVDFQPHHNSAVKVERSLTVTKLIGQYDYASGELWVRGLLVSIPFRSTGRAQGDLLQCHVHYHASKATLSARLLESKESTCAEQPLWSWRRPIQMRAPVNL